MSYIYLPCNLYKAWRFGQFLMHFDRLWGVDARNLEDDWRAEARAAMAVPHYSEERCQTLEGLTELHGLRIPKDYEDLRLPLSLKKLRYTKKKQVAKLCFWLLFGEEFPEISKSFAFQHRQKKNHRP